MKFLEKLQRILTADRNTGYPAGREPENLECPGSHEPDVSAVQPLRPAIEGEEKIKRISSLTQREMETFKFLLEGYTLKETAEQMGIKYPTVNTYMTGVYRKLGINSRAELIIHYRDIK